LQKLQQQVAQLLQRPRCRVG